MESKYPNKDLLLKQVANTHGKRLAAEQNLALIRAESRELCLALIFDHGFNLSRVQQLSGHMRPTLRVWVAAEAARRGYGDYIPGGES